MRSFQRPQLHLQMEEMTEVRSNAGPVGIASFDEGQRACRRISQDPPETSKRAPDTNADFSDKSHITASATSLAVPTRFIGIVTATFLARSSPPNESWIAVEMNAGTTAFTRIPSAATSLASPIVNVLIVRRQIIETGS